MHTGFENSAQRSRRTIAALWLVAFSVAALLAVACSGGSSAEGKACTPGSTQPCVGAGACLGGQSCRSDGTGYDACDCGNQADVGPGDVGSSFESSLADSANDAFDSSTTWDSTTWDSESSAAPDSEASADDSHATQGEDGSGSSSGGSSSSGGASGSSGSGSSSSSSSGSASGSSSGSGSGSSSGSTGVCTAAASVSNTLIPPYVPVVRMVNACSAAQITGFLAACTSATGSQSACSAYQMSAANAGCLACLFSATDGGASNAGGVLFDSAGTTAIDLNVPGCIALADPTNGPACAAALEPAIQCLFQACNTAACFVDPTTEQTCETAAESGACSSEVHSEQSACAADVADGGVATTTCGTPAGVLATICGM